MTRRPRRTRTGSFTRKKESDLPRTNKNDHDQGIGSQLSLLLTMTICRELKSYQTNSHIKVANDAAGSGTMGLVTVAEILRKNIHRIYSVQLDTYGFYADDAVASLQRNGLADTEEEAEAIGLALEKIGYIQNVKSTESFRNARLFFRYSIRESTTSWEQQVDKISNLLYHKLQPKDHFYHRRRYKDCFLGTEVVDLLVLSGTTSSRVDAVLLGRAVAFACNLFRHVVNEHILEDKRLFYVFNAKTRHSVGSSAEFKNLSHDD